VHGADLFTEQEAVDTTIQGPQAVPVRGLAATIDFQGIPVQDSDLERIFATIFEDADRYRRRFVPEWLKAYQQYNGDVVEAGKLPWQSKLNIPKPKQAVDLSTARVMDSIVSNEDFFDILPYVQMDDSKTDTAKKMIKWQLAKSEFRQPVQTSVKDAFICGFGPMKVVYEESVRTVTTVDVDPATGMMGFQPTEERKNRLRMDPIIPTDLWLDPSGRNRFVIHRTRRSISDLWTLADDQIDPLTGQVSVPAVYDREKVKDVKPGSGDTERDAQDSIVKRDTPFMSEQRGVDVYEYWGDLYDPSNGAVLFKNIVATFVNKRVVIRRPQSNPFRHGNAPFVIFHPTLAPHQLYGYGLLTAGSLIQDSLVRGFNIIMDKMMLQVPTVQAYPSSLRNPSELGQDNEKFYPGRTWLGKDPEKPIFVPVDGFQPPSQEDFMVVDKLSSYYDQSTGVNEFATGTPQTDNRKTKEEVQSRVGATQQVFNDAAQQIEQSGLSPLIKMMYYLMVQFEQDYGDPNLLRMFGEQQQPIIQQLATLSPEQRWQAMYLDAEFRVTGVSLAITRNDRIQRMMQFKQVVSADQGMNAILNRREELRWWMKVFDIPQQLLLDPNMVAVQAEETMLLQQILGPQMGGMQGSGGENATNAAREGGAGGEQALDQANANENSKAQTS
jgi:hypothetical protein